jgi:protein TonB
LSPLNNLTRPRRIKDPVFLTLLLSVGLHSLLVFPFWRFETLHLTVPDRPMRMVLEIPLTKQIQTAPAPRPRIKKIMPPKTPSREKPVVKPIEKPPVKPVAKLPDQPQEKPANQVVELPEPPPAPVEPVRPVEAKTEAKPPVLTEAEPVKTALPEPIKIPSAATQVIPGEVAKPVSPVVKPAPAPPVVKPVSAPPLDRPAVSAAYLKTVNQRIQKVKRYPRLARDRGIEGEALLEFVLAHDGKLVDTRILRSSGFAILDREALRTVRRATPFPKLPEGTRVGRVVLKVMVSFALTE